MEAKQKCLSRLILYCLLFGSIVVVAARSSAYRNLTKLANITVDKVAGAKRRLIGQLSINDPLISVGNKTWYFGVSDCWNTTLTEEERLTDSSRRLRILKKYAVVLNISGKSYMNVNLAAEISNLYRAIDITKSKILGYPRITAVTGQTIGRLTAKTPREQSLIEAHYLATLQKNLLLIAQDFSTRTPTAV